MPVPGDDRAPGIDLPQAAPPTTVQVNPAQYPARTRQAAHNIHGTRTDVTSIQFADKIMLTVSQEGKLAHWVHVPLEPADPTAGDRRPTHQNPAAFMYDEEEPEPGNELLPLPHLTATTILGAGAPQKETIGQLLATQVASAIAARKPEERRLLVLGLGLNKDFFSEEGLEGEDDMVAFQELVALCVGVV